MAKEIIAESHRPVNGEIDFIGHFIYAMFTKINIKKNTCPIVGVLYLKMTILMLQISSLPYLGF